MKHRQKKHTSPIPVSKQLFRTYATLFFVFFFLLALIFLLIMGHSIKSDIIKTQMQTSQTMTQAIDNYFSDMNTFSLTLMNSVPFKQAVIEDIPSALFNGQPQTDYLTQAYRAAYQMYEKGYRIGVATNQNVYIWMADRILVQPVCNVPDLYDNYHGYGKPVLFRENQNAYLHAVLDGSDSSYYDSPTIVLARSINQTNAFAQPQAMLEVHTDVTSFSAYMESLIGRSDLDQLRISVLGSDGSLLYGDADSLEISPRVQDNPNSWTRAGKYMVKLDTFFGGNAHVYYQIPQSIYWNRMFTAMWIAVLIFAAALGVMVFTTYSLSKKITRPVSQLCDQLVHISLTKSGNVPKVHTNLYELDKISQVVEEMEEKLSHSMQENLIAHTSELQSRLMALQSQMQPHFLYNTLAVISSLSEQGNQQAVSKMCLNLSQMLRYVSAKEEGGVSMYHELSFLKSYITIMSERFPKAQVHINIPLDMMDLRIPKLVIQPLCENSFKYVGRNDIEIWVTGQIKDGFWTVTVRDNGDGFSRESIEILMDRCYRLYEDKEVLSTQVNGMGLVNIYARLSLFYKNQFIFELQEHEGVSIGGNMHAIENEN